MRKIRYIVGALSLIIALPFLSACAFQSVGGPTNSLSAIASTNSTESITTESRQIDLTTDSSITSWYAQISPVTYSSIEDLLNDSDLVIIGTVTKMLPTVRVQSTDCVPDKKGFGMQQDSLNITSANVRIEQVIKGNISVGESIRLDQDGGLAEGIMETISPYRYLEDGIMYLMFVRHIEDIDISKYFAYSFASVYDGFMAIKSGKVYPWEYSNIFLAGTSVEDAMLALQPKVIVIPAEMPDDFAIYFAFGVNPKQKNVLDAYPGGGIMKDLIENGTWHNEFSIEKIDLAAIYKKMQELSLLGLTGKIVGGEKPPTLNNTFLIKYRINGSELSVSGDSTTATDGSLEAKNLELFRRYLEAFMMNTEEYKHMPAAVGVYR